MRMKLLKKEHCTSKSAETCIEHGALSAPPSQVQEHFRHTKWIVAEPIIHSEIALDLITNM